MVGAGFPGRILRVAVLASLLFSSTVFVSPSFGGKRDAPIRLRENLWATGHFMGKKSTLDSSHLPPLSEERVEPGNVLEAFSPALTDVFEDAKGLLMRELLKIILQQRLLEEEQGKGEAKGQETPSLMELLAKYI
ncbi:uncharacterized protein LOC144584586 [Pogona vitticeps]